MTNLPTRKIGSVADIDPVNEYYGSLTPSTNNNHVPQHQPPPPPDNMRVIGLLNLQEKITTFGKIYYAK